MGGELKKRRIYKAPLAIYLLAFLLSLVVGLVSGVRGGNLVFRPFIFGLVGVALWGVVSTLVKRYLPELLDLGSPFEELASEEEAENPGQQINILVGDESPDSSDKNPNPIEVGEGFSSGGIAGDDENVHNGGATEDDLDPMGFENPRPGGKGLLENREPSDAAQAIRTVLARDKK